MNRLMREFATPSESEPRQGGSPACPFAVRWQLELVRVLRSGCRRYWNGQTSRYDMIHKKESLRFQAVKIIEKSLARLQQQLLVLGVFGRTGHARLRRHDERRHFPRRNVFSHFACLDPAGERGRHGLSPRDIDLLQRLAEFFIKG